MTKKAKVLLAAVGLVAIAAAPAMAATHHVRTHHVQTERAQTDRAQTESVAPSVADHRLPQDYYYYDGYQRDRQVVGTTRD